MRLSVFRPVAALWMLGALPIATLAAEDRIDRTMAAEPQGEVQISNVSGTIDVRGWDRNEVKVTGIRIDGIAYDSRRVPPASLYVAVPGFHVDGHDFVRRAVAAGAAAVVVRHDRLAAFRDLNVPVLGVQDTRVALSAAAAHA